MDNYYTGSPAGFGTDRAAARHVNKARPAAVVLFLDELVDPNLGNPITPSLWSFCGAAVVAVGFKMQTVFLAPLPAFRFWHIPRCRTDGCCSFQCVFHR